jgi:hypothetical protein
VSLGDPSSAFQDEEQLQVLMHPGSERPAKRQRLNNSRCFNCGSYAHGLRDCPQERDQQAVEAARAAQQAAAGARLPPGNVRYFGGGGGGGSASKVGCCWAWRVGLGLTGERRASLRPPADTRRARLPPRRASARRARASSLRARCPGA